MTATPSDQPQSDTDETAPPPAPSEQGDTTSTGPASEPDTAAVDSPPAAPGDSSADEGQAAEGQAADEPASEDLQAADEPASEQPQAAGATEAADEPQAADGQADGQDGSAGEGRKGKKKRGKKSAGDTAATAKPAEKRSTGPDPQAIIKQIGTTSAQALAYVKDPDPKLSRMSRKHREVVITDIPPVTAGALLGPDALCRHFLASAASGRYQDLFYLWDLFVLFPEDCKPVLASRQRAQEKARAKLRTATHLGLLGDASRVASDIDRATGLPWRWLQETLDPMGPAIVQRPAVLAAMKRRFPDYEAELPEQPSDRWLAEAATLRESGSEVPADIDSLLGAHADRLPATVATLSMAHAQYPDRVPALIDRVDLEARDIAATLAWARDHGHAEQLVTRIGAIIEQAAAVDRATGLSTWKKWQDRGVDVAMPESLRTPDLEGLDLGRPESAELIKVMVDGGADLDPQQILDDVAAENRMRGEKAFEAFVCAGFDDVHLPLALEGNPMVRPETRCPACQAWTWVRPGLEKRCPRTGCPLRTQSVMTPEDAAAAVDAAVADVEQAIVVDDAQPSPSATGPTPAPAQPRPAMVPDTAAVAVEPPFEPVPTEPVPTEPVQSEPVPTEPADDSSGG